MAGWLENRELEADLPEHLNLPPPLNFQGVKSAVPLTISPAFNTKAEALAG